MAGLAGATVIAIWFFVIDAAAGRPLHTPATLGSALLLGATSPAGIQVTPLTVGGYTIVHGAAFITLGIIAAALVAAMERYPPFAFAVLLLFVTFEAFFVALLAIAAAWILDTLGWASIAAANLIAAGVMGLYLWRRHPRLRIEEAP